MTSASHDPASRFFWEETPDRTEMCSPGLRMVFARKDTFWTHSVVLPRDDGVEIARAIDFDPDRDDPSRVVSPVYQEIQRHENSIGSALCLLLTGTFFKHHFSAVVTLGADPDRTDWLTLEIDVADRCRTAVECLAATYTVKLDSGALADAGPHAIIWENVGRSHCRLELIAIAPSTLALAEAGRNATRVQALAAIQTGSYTHRLHYRWRWTSNSGLTR
jgi:hypothetical protein